MDLKIKKLEIQPEKKGIKEIFHSRHLRRSLKAIIIGAAAGFVFFYLTEGKDMETLLFGEVMKSLLIGGFFGFFITNSPCARNKC